MPTPAPTATRSSPAMPPHEPGTGRGATVRAVLYFLASTPFLLLLAVGLHVSGVLTLDKVTELLHGRKAEPVANATPAPAPAPGVDPPPPPTMRRPPGVNPDPVVPPVVVVPPPNQPPQVTAESEVVFGGGDRTKVVEVRVADEAPTGVKVVVASQDEALVPAAGLRADGVGSSRVLTVTPAAGKWGKATLRVTATDAAGLSGEAVIRVTVPPPAFTLAAPANVTVKRGESITPVALVVADDSPVPGKVTFTALVSGSVLKADGVKVENGRVVLAPVKDALGAATVTVIAASSDGREDRKTFTLTVAPPPPPPLVVGAKARVTPAGGADVISSHAQAVGGANLGVPDLERGTEVRLAEVRGNRVRVTWGSNTGWLDGRDLTTFE